MVDSNVSLSSFTDVFADEIANSQPLSLSSKSNESITEAEPVKAPEVTRPAKHTGQYGEFRSVDEIDKKYRGVFSYPFFNLVQSRVIEDAIYSDKSIVVCAPTGSGKTVVFEMAIVQLLMEMEDKNYTDDFKIIYMAPVKAVCTERLTEWYAKFTKLGLLCIEVTGDTDVDFSQLKSYKIIITTPEKWDILTRRWTDYRGLVEVIKLFLIDEVHILNDETRGPVLEAVVSRMKTIEASSQSAYRIEQLQKQYQGENTSQTTIKSPPRIRFVAVSATVSNPEDVADWLGTPDKKAVFHKFGDECRPVKLKRIVEGYPCSDNTSIFKFDLILNYKLWPIIQKYYDGKPTLIFCNTRKSVMITAETLAKELTVSFNPEQRAKLAAIASNIKNKKIQTLVANGVGCHHAGLLFEERMSIEQAFRQRDLPILITTTTLAMGVNLPAHLVIIKNTQQYVNGAYQEYSISTVLQMVGRAGRPQFDTEATAVIMTRSQDKPRYQSLVGGSEPLQSYLHKRLTENLNSEAALHTVTDVAQCVQWLRSTFLYVRAAKDPRRYLGLPPGAPAHQILKKIEELCVKAMNGLASAGLITMDEACCIQSTTAGVLMSVYYLDFETMKLIMKIEGSETLEQLLLLICDSHELSDMYLRVDERRCLNTLNRNNNASTIRFPMKGKISTRQMKVNCIIQAVLGCLPIPDPSLNQEAMKIMRIADRVCKCLVAYMTRQELIYQQPKTFSAILYSIILAKCISAHLWENSPFVSKQMKGIGPTFSTFLATAGKVSILLLEESHPRDLERIMNKGPPAGNVLHKQILLLPKYQIALTPIDEKSVTIQVMLLNQHYLAENIDNLTAGDSHKCYIVVGDSENHILLLNSFKDRDLISVYDGCISFTITRKHRFEHKILVHCVSSTFVGIDEQNEYTFKDLDPENRYPQDVNNPPQIDNTPNKKKPVRKPTTIKESFKERKRKSSDLEISQSKEKKKRDNALLDRFRYLKKSFSTVANEMKEDLKKSTEMANMTLNKNSINIMPEPDPTNDNPESAFVTIPGEEMNINYTRNAQVPSSRNHLETVTIEDSDCDDEMRDYEIDDGKFDSIMNEIEKEITNKNENGLASQSNTNVREPITEQKKPFNTFDIRNNLSKDGQTKPKETNQNPRLIPQLNKFAYKQSRNKYTKPKPDNYKFLDVLENKMNEGNEDFDDVQTKKDSGFSDAIKSEIQKFLQKAQTNVARPNSTVDQLLLIQKQPQDIPNIEHQTVDLIDKKDDVIWLDKVTTNHDKSYEDSLQKSIIKANDKMEQKRQHSLNQDLTTDEPVELIQYTDKEIEAVKITSTLPDVVLVHSHNNTNGNEQNFKEFSKPYNYSKENDLLTRSSKSCIVDAKTAKAQLLNDVDTEIVNFYVIGDNPKIDPPTLHPECYVVEDHATNVNVPQGNDKEHALVVSNEYPVSDNNDEVRKALIPYNQVQTEPMNDIIMLSESQEDFNNISQNFTKISLLDKTNNPKTPLEQIELNTNEPRKSINVDLGSVYRSNLPKACYEATTSRYNPSKKTRNYNESTDNIEHTRKYSYTKTNIDVCTQKVDSKKFTFKTIKKMKIDLDITQIVSVEKLESPKQKVNIKEIECPNFNASYQNNDMVAKSSVFQRRTGHDHIDNVIPSIFDTRACQFTSALALANVPVIKSAPVTRHNENQKIKNDDQTKLGPSDDKRTQPDSTKVDFETRPATYTTTTKRVEKFIDHHTESSNVLKDPSNTKVAKNLDAINEDIENQPVFDNSEKKDNISETKRVPNTIDSILQKYALKLKEKSTALQTQNSQQPKETSTTQQQSRPKRPFKIKEIQMIKAQIPSMITKDISPVLTPPVNEKEFELKPTDSPVAPLTEIQETKAVNIDHKATAPVYSMALPEIEEAQYPEVLENDDSVSEVDNVMFNPKMLLEQYNKIEEEEYIPPPPQFCDELYSPSRNLDTEINEVLELNDNTFCDDEDFGESNFEALKTNEHIEEEVETWTLSEDDRIESNYPSDYLYSSQFNSRFTIGSHATGQAFSRRDRLGKFKFNKNKFSARRN